MVAPRVTTGGVPPGRRWSWSCVRAGGSGRAGQGRASAALPAPRPGERLVETFPLPRRARWCGLAARAGRRGAAVGAQAAGRPHAWRRRRPPPPTWRRSSGRAACVALALPVCRPRRPRLARACRTDTAADSAAPHPRRRSTPTAHAAGRRVRRRARRPRPRRTPSPTPTPDARRRARRRASASTAAPARGGAYGEPLDAGAPGRHQPSNDSAAPRRQTCATRCAAWSAPSPW